jgi:MIP family channel proteins
MSQRKLPVLSSSVPCYRCKRECISELIGTYILVVVGPATLIVLSLVHISALDTLLLVALAFGGTVAIMILVFGRYSGSVINPALTLALASARLLKKDLVIPYLFFQLVGGILAGLTLRAIFLSSVSATDLGSTKLAGGVSPIVGLVFELVGTFVLASSAMLAATRIKKIRHQALFVGFTLSVLIFFIGPLTSAGLNPARSLGPSLASGYLENLYVYVVGPFAGALLAGLLFKKLGDRNGISVCLC